LPPVHAAVYHGPRDIRVEEVPEPEAGPSEVVVEVARNGICGSDLHTYTGAVTGGATMHVPGVILGHEFAGVVRSTGADVDDIAVGTPVAVAPIEWCGRCWPCRQGWPNLCRRLALYGGYRLALHGGLAPLVAVSRRSLFPVPDGLDVANAALAEPVAVAVHAVRRAPVPLGASVMVLGAGPIGLAVLGCVRAAGAAITVVTDVSAARRAAAERFGATQVVDPAVGRPAQVARELVGPGVDVVFDTTGVDTAVDDGLSALRAHGTLVSVAGWQQRAQLDMGRLMSQEIDVRFTMTYLPAVDFPVALRLLAEGTIPPAEMVSDHIPLAHVVEHGLKELLHHADRHVKILVDPNAPA
jgi:(R,R)-butanediol dehydrogenase/meso-butanediol dehydrogenase/diacetyl reductase